MEKQQESKNCERLQKSLVEQAGDLAGQYGGFSFGGQHPRGVNPYRRMTTGTVFPNGAEAAILLTFDVEGCYGNGAGAEAEEVINYRRICEKIQQCGITATFCVLGQMAQKYGGEFVGWMLDAGCEVASHGYWHDLDRVFEKGKTYAAHYGLNENLQQIKRGIEALNSIKDCAVRGIRLPYGCFNEFSYQAMEQLGLTWTSHVGIDDFVVPGQGFGPLPFQMQLGDQKYNIVEIPLDSQTYDWSIWVADDNTNKTFVDAVKAYCASRKIEFNRTPRHAVNIWKQRIADTIQQQSIFTLLCHPINLTIKSERWTDAVEEFLFPVIEYMGRLAQENKIWVCTCSQMADYYNSQVDRQ